MASLSSLYGGSSNRKSVQTMSGSAASSRSAAPVKQLLRRLQYTLRRSVSRPRRAALVSFGYDLESYSQNFDDGLDSSLHRL
ncbi:hypothetical protein EJB05_22042, partial [Eragrostis curvula]